MCAASRGPPTQCLTLCITPQMIKGQASTSVGSSSSPVSSPARRRAASAYAPGSLPMLPPSPKSAGLMGSPSFKFSSKESILVRREDSGLAAGGGGTGPLAAQVMPGVPWRRWWQVVPAYFLLVIIVM